nr:hypothetical protein [Tanacetum cinerariifolium]
MNETFHVQKDDELTEKELKQIEADDQAIQTILLCLPEDIYTAIDNDLKAERLAKTQDPLALIETSNNPYTFPVLNQDQPSFNQNYMQQPIPNPKDIIDPTTMISSNPHNRQIAQPGMNMGQDRQMQMIGGYSECSLEPENPECWKSKWAIGVPGNANQNSNGNGNLVAARAEVRPRRRDAAYLQTQLLIAQKEEAGIQLQAEEFDLMAAVADLDEIKEVNENCYSECSLEPENPECWKSKWAIGVPGNANQNSNGNGNLVAARAEDRSAEVHNYENCYDNEIFNMFT